MTKVTLIPSDSKMLELIEQLKNKGLIRFRQEFCDAIDLPKQNIRNIKNGIQHFTAEHIRKACKEYKVNANWIMNLEKNVFKVPASNGVEYAINKTVNRKRVLTKKRQLIKK